MSLSPWTLDRADSAGLLAMLRRLDPQGVKDYLAWCCRQVKSHRVWVKSHTGTAEEAWQDLVHLSAVFGLDLEAAAVELARRVRAL